MYLWDCFWNTGTLHFLLPQFSMEAPRDAVWQPSALCSCMPQPLTRAGYCCKWLIDPAAALTTGSHFTPLAAFLQCTPILCLLCFVLPVLSLHDKAVSKTAGITYSGISIWLHISDLCCSGELVSDPCWQIKGSNNNHKSIPLLGLKHLLPHSMPHFFIIPEPL